MAGRMVDMFLRCPTSFSDIYSEVLLSLQLGFLSLFLERERSFCNQNIFSVTDLFTFRVLYDQVDEDNDNCLPESLL